MIEDIAGTQHSVEVTAASLYEAVALALAAFRAEPWVGEIGRGLTTATVTVRHPEVKHVVKIQQFERWLNGGVKAPAEMVLKDRLKRLLNQKLGER